MTETTPNNLPLKKTHPRSGAIEPVVYVLVWQALSQHCLAAGQPADPQQGRYTGGVAYYLFAGRKGKADQVPSIDT